MKITILLFLLLMTACENDRPNSKETLPESHELASEGIWTEEYMGLVNAHRTAMGLRSLIHHQDLGEIARQHSQSMALGSVIFCHSGFSSRCTQSRKVLEGGNWCAENIEHDRSTHTGFGYAKSSNGKYYWTQIFLEH
jgi:uncharacterized protein YkwD